MVAEADIGMKMIDAATSAVEASLENAALLAFRNGFMKLIVKLGDFVNGLVVRLSEYRVKTGVHTPESCTIFLLSCG